MPYSDEEKLVSTIADALKKGIGRQMDIALNKINANTKKIILLTQSLAEKFNLHILLPSDGHVSKPEESYVVPRGAKEPKRQI